LKNLYLVPLGVTNTELARVLGVSRKAISSIVNEHKSVTPEMALRLSRAFPNTSPEFWLNLQKNYDLWHAAHDSQDWQNVRPISAEVPAGQIVYPDLSEQHVASLNALRESGTERATEEAQRDTEKETK
jgi:addiction module HigA family antidote